MVNQGKQLIISYGRTRSSRSVAARYASKSAGPLRTVECGASFVYPCACLVCEALCRLHGSESSRRGTPQPGRRAVTANKSCSLLQQFFAQSCRNHFVFCSKPLLELELQFVRYGCRCTDVCVGRPADHADRTRALRVPCLTTLVLDELGGGTPAADAGDRCRRLMRGRSPARWQASYSNGFMSRIALRFLRCREHCIA